MQSSAFAPQDRGCAAVFPVPAGAVPVVQPTGSPVALVRVLVDLTMVVLWMFEE